jgi:hypothetical protein
MRASTKVGNAKGAGMSNGLGFPLFVAHSPKRRDEPVTWSKGSLTLLAPDNRANMLGEHTHRLRDLAQLA